MSDTEPVELNEEEGDEEEEEEEEYEVERIIKSKKMQGSVYYLVRWKNYGSDDDTWEPEDNLVDCAEAFEEFKKAENERAAEKAKALEKKKIAALGQKRRRTDSSQTKTSKAKTKKFISSDDDSDGGAANSPVRTPPSKKLSEKVEIKKTYKFLSDSDDDFHTQSTVKPEKKTPKIPKKHQIKPQIKPQTKHQKSDTIVRKPVIENAHEYFNDDHNNSDIVKAKREKKKKKREKSNVDAHNISQNNITKESESVELSLGLSHLDDLLLPFGVDIRVPHLDGTYRVTQPIPLEFEDPSGKMSGLENINWSLAVYYDALDLLIKSNCIQDVQTLLEKQKLGINQLYGERTLVSLSALHGKRRMTEMLLKYYPDVNQLLDKGRIALHLAAEQGHTEICVNLIEAGSNINLRDVVLETPLMKAAEGGHRATVDMLLDYGANFSLVNSSFKTAEDLAREKQHEFIAQKIHYHAEQVADAFINVHKTGNSVLKEQLFPVHTIFPEFNSTFTLCFTTDVHITCKLIVSRHIIRKGDIGKLLDYSLIKCQWMNQILSLEYPGSVIFQPRLGLNTLVLNFKEHIKKYGIEPLLVSAFSVLVTNHHTDRPKM